MKNVLEKYLLASVAMTGVCAINVGLSWATFVMVVPGGTDGDGCCACTVTNASPNCVATDCASLGYKQTETDCSGLKSVRCPFDVTKYYCPSSTTMGGDTTECPSGSYPMMEYVRDTLGYTTVNSTERKWYLQDTFPGGAPSASDSKWHFNSNGASILISCTGGYSFNQSYGSYKCADGKDSYTVEIDNVKCRFKVGSDGTEKDFAISIIKTGQKQDQFRTLGYNTTSICNGYKTSVLSTTGSTCYKFSPPTSLSTGGSFNTGGLQDVVTKQP